MISEAYQMQRNQYDISATTRQTDLMPYMNYVVLDTSTTITGGMSCSSQNVCLKLHNGGILAFGDDDSFGGITPLNALWFMFDPDGAGTVEPVELWVYTNGKIRSNGTLETGTNHDAGGNSIQNDTQAPDPSWFSWN